jgi:GR25 family glycosyltransferase involved in LPS biosynthesis
MIADIPKFVINLNRRTDRLEHISSEMSYMGWNFNRFEGIDTGSYVGCALSHQAIANIALKESYDYIMIFEDDIFFMPYAKEFIVNIENQLFNTNLQWDVFHFAPSIHRPLNQYNKYLLDLTNTPPKDISKHRGIFGTSGFILSNKAYSYIIEWNSNKYIDNINQQIPIDEYYDLVLYPNLPSFCGVFPIIVQKPDYSDINKTFDQNHYLMTYNWNQYCPIKLDNNMFDFDYCYKLRNYENKNSISNIF